jgi:diguanylate cyclase (GGDEF)-like protein
MRDILELCIQIDELASRAYTSMATDCIDAEVGSVLGALAIEETEHVSWWRDLLSAWERGLLPDIYADTGAIREQMLEILSSMEVTVPDTAEPISAKDALATAVSIEFFMLDPLFGELQDLAEPAVARKRHDSYARHIDRLAEAVERHYRERPLAAFLAPVLRRAWRENRALATHAMRDTLTGLSNRRAFAAHLKQWAAWSARYGRPMAVVLIDIDDFKHVNESAGHSVGDTVLTAVGRAIREVTRASDLTARYGGDEFAVLAPETGPEEARHLADRILEAVRKVRVGAEDGSMVSPTVSVGMSVAVDPADSEPRSTDQLLAAADHGLYAAKQAGRDRASDPAVLAYGCCGRRARRRPPQIPESARSHRIARTPTGRRSARPGDGSRSGAGTARWSRCPPLSGAARSGPPPPRPRSRPARP